MSLASAGIGRHMSLDVAEATRQLNKDKTAIVQCADGMLCYLRGITDNEAVGEPLDGGNARTHLLASCIGPAAGRNIFQ